MSQESGSACSVPALGLREESVERTGYRNLCLAASKRRAAVALRQSGSLHIHHFHCSGEGFDDVKDTKLAAVHICDAALMNDSGTRLILLNTAEHCIYDVDMECGSVVQEMRFADKRRLQAIAHSAHIACAAPLYTCLAETTAFTLDMRSNRSYANCSVSSRNIFTCHATSACGHLVTGDDAGIVRLFKGPPTLNDAATPCDKENAKAPIVDVDITANGELVIVVCAKYILLWRPNLEEKGFRNVFNTLWGKKHVLYMQPSASQLAALGGEGKLNFSSGGFDRYGTDKETCIMACSGNYIFTWSFEAVSMAWECNEVPLPESARADHRVLAISAVVPGRLIYVTNNDIRMVPVRWTLPM